MYYPLLFIYANSSKCCLFTSKLDIHQNRNRRNLLQPLLTTNLRDTDEEYELLYLNFIRFSVTLNSKLLE